MNEADYNRIYGNKKVLDINISNNIRTNNHNNQDINLHNIKPLVLKKDRINQQGNNNININTKNLVGYKNSNNKGIKFNGIIKLNTLRLNNYNYKLQNLNVNLKNIKLKKLKTDDIKIRNPMPTLTGNISDVKNNKIFEENNNLAKQRRFVTNDNVGRRSNLSEHKKYGNGSNKLELNINKKNTSDKIILLNKIK